MGSQSPAATTCGSAKSELTGWDGASSTQQARQHAAWSKQQAAKSKHQASSSTQHAASNRAVTCDGSVSVATASILAFPPRSEYTSRNTAGTFVRRSRAESAALTPRLYEHRAPTSNLSAQQHMSLNAAVKISQVFPLNSTLRRGQIASQRGQSVLSVAIVLLYFVGLCFVGLCFVCCVFVWCVFVFCVFCVVCVRVLLTLDVRHAHGRPPGSCASQIEPTFSPK